MSVKKKIKKNKNTIQINQYHTCSQRGLHQLKVIKIKRIQFNKMKIKKFHNYKKLMSNMDKKIKIGVKLDNLSEQHNKLFQGIEIISICTILSM